MTKTERLADSYDSDIVATVAAIVETAERFRNSYFWTPPKYASSRGYMERENTYREVEWGEGGHAYTAKYNVSCSCRNVYAHGTYTRDGEITNLTAIRNSLKRMQVALADNKKTAQIKLTIFPEGLPSGPQKGEKT